jgi:pyruvate,water dikinase
VTKKVVGVFVRFRAPLQYGQEMTDVAVRSSATAEDLPDASFAGQQETFLT